MPEPDEQEQKHDDILSSLNVAALGVGVGRGAAAALQKLRDEGEAPGEERLRELGAQHGYAVVKEFDLD